MIIEVLDKHYGRLTTIKEIIDWHGVRNVETNDDRILIRFRKKGNDMNRIKNGVLLRIFDQGKTAYVPIMQLFDNYSYEEAEIMGAFKLVREDNIND